MENLPVVVFSYKIDDLLEEVTKRTSYIGKMRGTEQELHLLDRLSLTRGENFMFTEFIEDAASNVYDWLKAFGRKVKHAYHAKCVFDESVQYKHHGALITIDGVEADADKRYVYKGIAAMANVLSNRINATVPNVQVLSKIETVDVTIEYRFIVETHLPNYGKTSEVKVITNTATLDKGVKYPAAAGVGTSIYIPFEFNENGDIHELKNVDLEIVVKETPVNVVPIKAETYVEYHPSLTDLSAADYYQVVKDCTNADWFGNADKLPSDPRGNVMFVLEQTSYFDVNMIHSIDRNIKEAIVNYIIYRWFEFVNEVEAEKFYLKFDDYAHKAHIGMNSETKPIQRKYKLF